MTEYKSKYEIFERAWNGLKSQDFQRAVREDGISCTYKSPTGLRCAIGWCMRDEDLEVSVPEGSVSSLEVQRLAGINPDDEFEFVSALQRIHDESEVPEQMKQRLIGFAYAHKLTRVITYDDWDAI